MAYIVVAYIVTAYTQYSLLHAMQSVGTTSPAAQKKKTGHEWPQRSPSQLCPALGAMPAEYHVGG